MNAFDIILKYRAGLLEGLFVTFKLCVIVWTTGIVLGSALALAAARWRASVGLIVRFISFFLTGIPILVFLLWLHYPAQTLIGVIIDPFYTAALTLSILNVFAIAEALRAVLDSFPAEYVTSARVCGMTPLGILLHIRLPLILRQVVPTVVLIQVNMLQATIFASLISVEEVFRVVQRINAIENRPVAAYTALGMVFLLVCLPLNGLAARLHKRYARDFSER